MKKLYVVFLVFAFVFGIVVSANAQEVFFNYGVTKNISSSEDSSYLSVEYMHWLKDHDNFGFSVSWLNEGHFEEDGVHHRDGQSAQAWLRKFVIDQKFAVLGGLGPYIYYDTTGAVQDQNYRDEHGVGIECSLAGALYINERWIIKIQGNYIDAFNSFDSFSASIGLGYLLWDKNPEAKKYEEDLREYKNEITVFLGGVIVNSFDSETGFAEAVEYRDKLAKHVDWTISAINEGNAELINRKGVASQLWLTNSFFDDSLSLGVGAGPYVFEDSFKEPKEYEWIGSDKIDFAGLVSFSVSYRLSERWAPRISWSRVLSNYDKDSDIILAGVGFKF